jgi:hypothetical protein
MAFGRGPKTSEGGAILLALNSYGRPGTAEIEIAIMASSYLEQTPITYDQLNLSATLHQPEKSPSDLLIALLLFVVTCLFLSIFHDYTNLDGDEGIVLQGAQRVLEGQVPYRDFFAFYTPGSYYSIAVLFKVFGDSMFVARAELVLFGGFFSVITYFISRRVCPRWSALLAAYALTLTCLPVRFMVTHWDSTLLTYLALYFGILWIENASPAWAFAASSLVALAVLFDQTTGFGLTCGIAAGIGVIALQSHFGGLFTRRTAAAAALGFAWPFILTFGYFAGIRELHQMLSDWFWPLFHYSATNHTSYGYTATASAGIDLWRSGWGAKVLLLMTMGPLLIIPILPIMAVGIFARVALFKSRNQELGREWAYYVFVSAVLVGLLGAVLLTKRADFIHLDYRAPLFYLVLAWTADGLYVASRIWRLLKPSVIGYVLLSSTAFGVAALSLPLHAHHKISTIRGQVRTDDADHSLEYVLSHVAPGEKMFVYPYEPLYNFLTGTMSPTRFDFLELGMHTPAQFQESLQSLASDRTRVVLFETSVAEKLARTSPNTPLKLFAAKDPLQEYIFLHYRTCAGPMHNQYWTFLFMIRKDLPCDGERFAPAQHIPLPAAK